MVWVGENTTEPLAALVPDHPSPAVQVETFVVDQVIVTLSPFVREEEVALNESVGVEVGGVTGAGGGRGVGVERAALTNTAMV